MLTAPTPYPDELLTSALIRCCRWFNLSFATLMRTVLGLPQMSANFLFTFSLQAVANLYSTDPAKLLWEHTTFPYATAFSSAATFETAWQAAILGGPGMIHLRAVMKNALTGLTCRRFCSQCMRDDLRRWGETYWHRAHNLPGVFICTEHGCALSFTSLGLPDHHVVYQLPIECTPCPGPNLVNSPAAMELAVQSMNVLRRSIGAGEARSGKAYRAAAAGLGLLSNKTRVDEGVLSELVLRCFSREFLDDVDIPPVFKPCAWPAALLRPHWRNVSPVKHLMLEIALTSAGHEFADRLSFRRTEPAEILDALFEERATREMRRALRTGTVLSVADLVDEIDARPAYHQRMREFPRLRKVLREFRASAASARQLRAVDI